MGAYTVNGKIYGAPITSLSTSTIFYNVDLFKKLGIPVPPTYADLKASVPKFKQAGVIPLLHQGANAVMWPMWYFETLSQSSGDAVGLTQKQLDGKEPFDDKAAVEAFEAGIEHGHRIGDADEHVAKHDREEGKLQPQ